MHSETATSLGFLKEKQNGRSRSRQLRNVRLSRRNSTHDALDVPVLKGWYFQLHGTHTGHRINGPHSPFVSHLCFKIMFRSLSRRQDSEESQF
jgi:hypothetical protein